MKSKSFDVGFGTISVISIESRCRNMNRSSETPMSSDLEVEMDRFIDKTVIRIGYVPRLRGESPAKRQGFQAIFHASHGCQGSYPGAIPRLSVHNIIPNNSPVFDVVRSGYLARFEEMLRKGEASLRDQDEHGASLLFVCNTLFSSEQIQLANYTASSTRPSDHPCVAS